MKTKLLTVLLLCAVGGAAVAFHLRLEQLDRRQDNILSLVHEIDAGGATDHELTALAERVDGLAYRADRAERFMENQPVETGTAPSGAVAAVSILAATAFASGGVRVHGDGVHRCVRSRGHC